MGINVLIIGSGGREDALAWKIAASRRAGNIFCAPGNAGIARAETVRCVKISAHDQQAVAEFCGQEKIDLVVIGPEGALTAGLADYLRQYGLKVFGPSAAAARLESSKAFTRKLCAQYNIPSPAWRAFDDEAAAKQFIQDHDYPLVVKADGLAAGKGVTIAENRAQAEKAIDDILSGKFGVGSLLVEEFMEGEEASFFVLSDGESARIFGTAQDHKRAFDGDQGPNTGGMGAFSPAAIVSPAMEREIMAQIIEPTLQAMRDQNAPFTGVLYAGLMITGGGVKLVEFNVRFGDPECQVLMMRLKSDLLDLLWAAACGRLAEQEIIWHEDHAMTVVMATQGYPESYATGSRIEGLDEAAALDRVKIFHAATLYDDGVWQANGGRVLNVSACGKSLEQARAQAYSAIDRIHWPEGFFRSDIGQKF